MAQDILADGFVNLCIDTSLNFYEGKCRILVEGQHTGSETPDAVVAVTSPREIDARFGAGSVLAESLKKVFCTCPNNADIYAIPRADPTSSVAAVYTWTFAGPATSDGRIEIYALDGDYSINVLVETGDTATQIAAAVAAALPANFPYTPVAASGVITLTAKSKGTVGNFLNPVFNWRNRFGYAPSGVTFTSVLTTPGTGDLLPLDYASVLGSCCYSVFALLGGGAAYQDAWQTYLESLWSCDTPQCFGHGYVYNTGTLGQVLARDTNAAVFSRMAFPPSTPVVPWLGVAAYAALSACYACSNPELSIQGRQYGVLACLRIPQSCVPGFLYDEAEQLAEAGFVVTGPLSSGQGAYTSPYVFNDVTNNRYDEMNRPNATFRDANARRLAASTALAIATELQRFNGLGLFTRNTRIRAGIFGTNIRLMTADIRAWAQDNVGVLFSDFEDIDNDIRLVDDFSVAPKCQGDPTKLHLHMRYRPPVRIRRIDTTLQPKLLDNCAR
jgi:hypothetical protein